MVKTEGVHIPGYSGTWSSIKQSIICGVTYYLMESDLFGEDKYHIIMNDSGRCIMTSEDGFNPLYEDMDNKGYRMSKKYDSECYTDYDERTEDDY